MLLVWARKWTPLVMRPDRVKWHEKIRGSTKIESIWAKLHYKNKTHLWHFGPNKKKLCHTYDTSMTIIVTKPGIIIDVVGSYFYDKKSWQKMGFSSWAGRRRSCMTFFGPSMTEKTVVEARARKILTSSQLRWEVGAERCAFLSYTYACVCEALALTEPERGIALQKKYTSVMIRICHSRSHFLSCMYIHDKIMTESR